MNKHLFTLLYLLCLFSANAQKKEVFVSYISQPIKIDAILDEPVWQQKKPATNFWQYFPSDSILSQNQPEIYMLYDDSNLYIGIKVFADGNDYVTPSLRRDFRAGGSDNITLMFDTFNDGNNAFLFGVNPAGVRREALVSGGGTDLSGFTTSWDTKWVGETKIYDGYYISEWAIPLSAFKFLEGETKWRFNSYQFDTQSNTRNTWMRIPRSQNIFNLAFMGDMVFEKPLKSLRSPISLIPYTNGLVGRDYENGENISEFKVGGDAKFIIGNQLNVDLTLNPDFSQVEADNLITNLTRFEVNLPERRQFFIENNDLFGDFGDTRNANPFFSRRIGIAKDTTGINRPNDIIAGARLSGKLTNDLRIGVLNVQTTKEKQYQIGANNNTVIALQQRVFKRSNISALFVNRQNTSQQAYIEPENEYNRLVGVDYNLANVDNSWNGKVYFHKSFSPGISSDDYSSGISIDYNSASWRVRASSFYVGDNFKSDLGFIRRKGILNADPRIEYLLFPEKGKINLHNFSFSPEFTWIPDLNFKLSDYRFASSWAAGFQNTSEVRLRLFNRYTFLFNAFDPSRSSNSQPLPANTEYYYTSGEIAYRSDERKIFSYRLETNYGQFFNGKLFTQNLSLNLRIQPKYVLGMQVRYDQIDLPDPYGDNKLWLVGSNVDITFSKSLFWATLIQYSTQENNFGINARLQWRFAPLSDLFLVYNDNYFTDNILAPRYRSINLKVTYWLYL